MAYLTWGLSLYRECATTLHRAACVSILTGAHGCVGAVRCGARWWVCGSVSLAIYLWLSVYGRREPHPWRDPHMYERGTTHRAAAAGCTGPDGQRMMGHMSSCSVSDRLRWRISQHAMGYIQGALCPPQWTGALTTVCLSVDP